MSAAGTARTTGPAAVVACTTAGAGATDGAPDPVRLAAVLADPARTGAYLHGGIGAGKHRLAAAAAERLPETTRVLRVHGSPALTGIPFGALAPLLSGPHAEDEVAQVLHDLLDLVSAGPDVLVVVDEAHHLDRASCFALVQLVQSGRAKLLVLATDGLGERAGLAMLLEHGMLERFALEPLDSEQTGALAGRLLGAPVARGTARILHLTAAGNPTWTTALLAAARDDGALAFRGGLWVLHRLDLAEPGHLFDAVHTSHGRLAPEERVAVELTALAGPLLPEVLEKATGCSGTSLVQTGLLAPQGDRLAVAAWIHAETLRRSLPPGRTAELWRRCRDAERALALTDGRGDGYLGVLHSAESGSIPVAGRQLLVAAREANRRHDYSTVLRLCDAGDPADAPLQRERVQALAGQGRLVSASAGAERLVEMAATADEWAAACSLACVVLWRAGVGSAEFRAATERWRACLPLPGSTEGAGAAELDGGRYQHPEAAVRTLAMFDALAVQIAGRLDPDVLPGLRAVADRPGSLVLERNAALVLLAAHGLAQDTFPEDLAARLLGDSRPGSEAAGPVSATAPSSPATSGPASTTLGTASAAGYPVEFELQVAMGLVLDGRFEDAERVLRAGERTDPRAALSVVGGRDLIDGLASLRRGNLGQARELLHTAIQELELRDEARLLPLARGAQAWAGTVAGGPASYLDGTAPGRDWDSVPARYGDLYAVAAACRGLPSAEAARTLGAHLAELRRRGLPRLALEGRVLAYELGLLTDLPAETGGTAELLRDLARIRTPWVTAVHAVVAARGTGLGADAEAAADTALASGHAGWAALALADAVALHTRAGDTRARGRALRRLQALKPELGTALPPSVAGALAVGNLTAREREIATLVGGGLSNRSIARELTLSQRTVEGHLYRIYAKLGIGDRSELAQLY